MECRTHRRISELEAYDLMIKGFSPNYKGNPDLDRNRSATIPEDQNCSLFLVGLPPNITTHELLEGVRDIGRVYATHINPPEPDKGHELSAAKLVFFERKAAERFHHLATTTGFRLPSYPSLQHHIRVTWNRIRSAEADATGQKSRVLLISGPPSIVNEEHLCAYFDKKLIYQVDEIILKGDRALIEFRFGSYRCQSEAARMALVREFREYGVLCEFGKDPCDRQDKEKGVEDKKEGGMMIEQGVGEGEGENVVSPALTVTAESYRQGNTNVGGSGGDGGLVGGGVAGAGAGGGGLLSHPYSYFRYEAGEMPPQQQGGGGGGGVGGVGSVFTPGAGAHQTATTPAGSFFQSQAQSGSVRGLWDDAA
ncbi:hypothetical protein B0T21DRAFT_326029 [Apiosordaria backusii]|uniref:RRM domain-containing protein n=1 Tax=Apiosordaria backusii TaxID=314023 RepID=A0AA40ET61_9PEZI|nr:hypothetical protein B0T21DRAFT_326029 [Apiosordaria backusii]